MMNHDIGVALEQWTPSGHAISAEECWVPYGAWNITYDKVVDGSSGIFY